MSKRRPSGDGMVRKKDDGRWEGRIVIGHKENGDSIFRYIYAPTQKELTAKLRQEITAYDWSKDTNGLREPHLPAHHPGNRPNPAEQAHRSRPSTVLPQAQAGRPSPGCGAIWLRTL